MHAQKYRQGLAKIQGMGGAGRGGRGGVRGGAYGTMMGCASGLGGIAMNPGLAAQLSTPAGQREYLNSQLQQVRGNMCVYVYVLQAPCMYIRHRECGPACKAVRPASHSNHLERWFGGLSNPTG